MQWPRALEVPIPGPWALCATGISAAASRKSSGEVPQPRPRPTNGRHDPFMIPTEQQNHCNANQSHMVIQDTHKRERRVQMSAVSLSASHTSKLSASHTSKLKTSGQDSDITSGATLRVVIATLRVMRVVRIRQCQRQHFMLISTWIWAISRWKNVISEGRRSNF